MLKIEKILTLKKLYIIIIVILGITLIFNESYSKTQKKSIKKTSSTKTSTKKSSKPVKKTKSTKSKTGTKSKKKKTKKVKTVPIHEVLEDTILTDGVRYSRIITGTNKLKHSIHIVEADLSNMNISPAVLKAKNHTNELEKLQSMICSFDTSNHDKVVAAINANFWKAYSNSPIGPTIVNGEVIELNTHKRWSSAFFDMEGTPFIDNFYMKGTLAKNGVIPFQINSVNRRLDSTGIVIYNKFAGDTIPYIPSRTIKKVFEEALADTNFRDITDNEFDTIQFMQDLINNERLNVKEYKMPKIVLEYINQPAINFDIECKVISFDTSSSAMPVPENGCIVSFGVDVPLQSIPRKGDILTLRFSTNVYPNKIFLNAVSGTPRLVRKGNAKHEAYEEGSHGRRFINRGLPRSAFGYNKEKTKIYLVAVEPSYRNGNSGANLAQLASIMKKIGCWDAMNLDGGGSTTMVIDYKNVLWRSNPEASRKLSVGLGIIKKEQTLKSIFKKGG